MQDDNEDSFSINLPENYTLDLQAISKSPKLMSVTKMLALSLLNNNYMKVGDYLQSISNGDLDVYMMKIDQIPEAQGEELEDLMLVADMLATGEGLDQSQNAEQFYDRLKRFTNMIILESLKRKGLVKLFYENMSFGEDMEDKKIAEKMPNNNLFPVKKSKNTEKREKK